VPKNEKTMGSFDAKRLSFLLFFWADISRLPYPGGVFADR
jgi:hypothetical protein